MTRNDDKVVGECLSPGAQMYARTVRTHRTHGQPEDIMPPVPFIGWTEA